MTEKVIGESVISNRVSRGARRAWLAVLTGLLFTGSLITSPHARASVTNVEARVTFTNVVNGVTNGDTITIEGDVRRYTNGTLNAAATWIQSTNIVGHAATNTQIHLATYGVTGIDRVFTTNTNAIIIVSALGVFPVVSVSAGVGTVTYATNIWSEQTPLLYPNAAGYNEAERTNNASGLIDLINDVRPTNIIANGNPAWTNIVDLTSFQRISNKVTWTTTNYTGLEDGVRITNLIHLHGSNGTLADINIARGAALNLTNLSGTNVNLTNVFLRHVTFGDARITGTNVGLTNGFVVNTTNVNGVFSNLINYGSAIRSEGSGGNSFQAGSNALASGTRAVALGNGAVSTSTDGVAAGTLATNAGARGFAGGNLAYVFGDDGTAVGYNSRATNAATATGSGASATGYGSTAGGLNAVASGEASTANGAGSSATAFWASVFGAESSASAIGSLVMGPNGTASHSNSAAIGPPDDAGTGVATSTTNQLMLGTSRQVVALPGFYQGTASNLVTAAGQTNRIEGDLSFPRAAVTTIANGANRFNMGTNVFIDLTGSPSAAWTVDGIIFGAAAPRDGHLIEVRNGTGYDATFSHNSGLEATAAYRISTTTSTNVIFTNGACATLRYSASSSRWLLWNVFDAHEPSLTATATNAVSSIMTNGAFVLGSGATNIDFTTGITGYVSGSTVRLGVNIAPGSSTNQLIATNGTTLGTSVGTVEWTTGVTGYVSGAKAFLGVSASGSGVDGLANSNLSYVIGANGTTYVNAATVAITNALLGKVDELDGVATNLTIYAGSPGLTVVPKIGGNSNAFQVFNTNGQRVVYVETNNMFTASNATVKGALAVTGALTGSSTVSATSFFDSGFIGGLVLASEATPTGEILETSTTTDELGYLSGVTSALQTQLNAKVDENSGVATNLGAWQTLTVKSNVTIQGVTGTGPPVLKLLATNGNAGITFSVPLNAATTNNLVFDPSVFAAGQVLKVHGVSGQTVTLTNDTDNNSGGGGLTTNANQFGATVELAIKKAALLTNTVTYSATNTSEVVTAVPLNVYGLAAQTTNLFEISSNGTRTVYFNSNSFLRLPDGTATKPSIGWASDDDASATGFYRNGANQIAIAVNGGIQGYWAANVAVQPTQIYFDAVNQDVSLRRTAAGVMTLDAGGAGFNRLNLGSTTVGYPALGRTNGDLVVLGANGLFAGGNTNRLLVFAGGSSALGSVGGTIKFDNSIIASAGASETNLITYSVPAHTLTNTADRLKFRFAGNFAATANTKQLKVVFGSETILDTGAQIVNSGAWTVEGQIIRTGATAQECSAEFHGAGVTLFTSSAVALLAQTNGIATTLKMTSTAAGNGDTTNRTLVVEWHPAP